MVGGLNIYLMPKASALSPPGENQFGQQKNRMAILMGLTAARPALLIVLILAQHQREQNWRIMVRQTSVFVRGWVDRPMSRLAPSQYRMLKKGKKTASPPDIQTRVDAVLNQVEMVLPGFMEALVLTQTQFIYDPQAEWLNNDPSFDNAAQDTASCFSRYQLAVFFDDAGLEKSLPHECAHLLDVWAGFGSWSHVPGFVCQVPFSVQRMYGSPFQDFDSEKFIANLENLGGHALTLLKIICSPRMAEDRKIQANAIAIIATRDGGTDHFIMERWADFFEHHIWFSLRRLGVLPVGFSPNRYVSETYWRDNVLETLNEDALQVWNAALMQIRQMSKTTIKKIHAENRRMWREALHLA